MRWLFLTTLLLAGCGRADLKVQLINLGNDDPFANLAELSIVVQRGGSVIDEVRQPFDDGPLTLGPLDREGSVHLILAGYDSTGAVIARGESTPKLPERSAACCVHVCFCTIARFDNGECTCGSSTCDDC